MNVLNKKYVTELELCTKKSEIEGFLENYLKDNGYANSNQEAKLKIKIDYLIDYMCVRHTANTAGLTLQEKYDDLLETFLLGTWHQMCRKHDETDYDALFKNFT